MQPRVTLSRCGHFPISSISRLPSAIDHLLNLTCCQGQFRFRFGVCIRPSAPEASPDASEEGVGALITSAKFREFLQHSSPASPPTLSTLSHKIEASSLTMSASRGPPLHFSAEVLCGNLASTMDHSVRPFLASLPPKAIRVDSP